MIIAIHASGMPFNGATIPNGLSLGGSESAAYYVARELAALGHTVTVFTASQETGIWDDVTYEYHGQMTAEAPMGDRFHFTMRAPHDVVIVQRAPYAFAVPINAKLKIWWLHDIALGRNTMHILPNLINVDRVFTVSNWHRKQVSDVYGIGKEYVYATRNAVDYDAFEGLSDVIREPGALVFASRPERGLGELVGDGGIMESLTDHHLYVCGYENTTQQMAGYYHHLWARCEELPNVTNLGALGKRDLYELMARCQAYVYPTAFEDTSNIVSMESNAAGTPFIGCKTAALPETIGRDGSMLVDLKQDGTVDKPAFIAAVKSLSDPEKWERLHVKALKKRREWGDIASHWVDEFKAMLATKSANDPIRLATHFEHYSDIAAMNHFFENDIDVIERLVPGYRGNYKFFIDGDYADHYLRYYQYEKDRGVEYGPEDLTENGRFLQTADIVGQFNPASVLDYGCAHGHYVMNLLPLFPQTRFVGVDINDSNVKTARKWVADLCGQFKPHEMQCPEFRVGTHDTAIGDDEKFELIIAAEVLEHVPDPAAVIDSLKTHLTDTGTMLISVPYGAWEAAGYDLHKGWRAHIHHIERSDLGELFGDQLNYKLLCIPHTADLGHYIVTFSACDTPCGAIDYDRKILEQAPRETISACIIARDEANSIGRCLESIRPFVDEIIVGIDENTTDDTVGVCQKYDAHIIYVQSPLETGFAAARNATIEHARCDWVMWIDADETFEDGHNLAKYLRPNCFNGYGIKQHHVAADPAGLLTTDIPARIFRNHRNVEFVGFVHEHPAKRKKVNDGVGKLAVLPDVHILHTGYATENKRRARFARNWPLMIKEFRGGRARDLTKMLMIRDCSHHIRYSMESNGGAFTDELRTTAELALKTWREMVGNGAQARMVTQSIKYMSECVAYMGGGVEFICNFNHKLVGIPEGIPMSPEPIHGLYQTTDDIKSLMAYMTREITKEYEGKYY